MPSRFGLLSYNDLSNSIPMIFLSFIKYNREMKPSGTSEVTFEVMTYHWSLIRLVLNDPIIGMNSINDHKTWATRRRPLWLLYNGYEFIYQTWKPLNSNDSVRDGPDFKAFLLILDRIDYVVTIEPQRIPRAHKKRTEGPFKRLIDRTYQVYTAAIPLDLSLLDAVDFTTPVMEDPFCIVVKKADRVPFTLVLTLPYQPLVWLCTGLTLVLVTLLWPLVAPGQRAAKRRTTPLQTDRFGRALADTFAIFITGAMSRNVFSQPERIFLAFFLAFSIVLINSYTGQIMSFLTTPLWYPGISTLEEASQKLKRLFVTEYIVEFLQVEFFPEPMRVLANKYSVIQKSPDNKDEKTTEWWFFKEAVRTVARNSDSGILMSRTSFTLYPLLEEIIEDTQASLHMVPHCVVSPSFRSVPVVKGDGYYKVINTFYGSLAQGGFYGHWFGLQRNHMFANRYLRHPSRMSKAPLPLTLRQLVGPFMLLAMGLTLAGAVLGVQKLQRHYTRGATIMPARAKLRGTHLWISERRSRRNQRLAL